MKFVPAAALVAENPVVSSLGVQVMEKTDWVYLTLLYISSAILDMIPLISIGMEG